MIDINKKYCTRQGAEVRIYATDTGGVYPIHGAIRDGEIWSVRSWTLCGRYDNEASASSEDLIEVKPEQWVNLYKHGNDVCCGHYIFASKSEALKVVNSHYIMTVKLPEET